MKALLFLLLMIPLFAFGAETATTAPSWLIKLLDHGTSIIGAASVIAAITPTNKDNIALHIFRAVLDALAFNFGQAKNKK